MFRRIATMLCVVMLLVAASAWAQTHTEIRGVVTYIDPATRTVYFADGRAVQVAPGSTLTINGQRIVLEAVRPEAVRPGAPVVVWPNTSTTTVTTVTQPLNVAPPPPPVPPTPVVLVPPPGGQYVMGTVSRVDPVSRQIVLSNGTIVYVAPHTTIRTRTNALTINQLRTGDEILIQVRNPAVVAAPATVVTTTPVTVAADRYVGSALPYQSYADSRIEATDVLIMWTPQAR
jgi:hypothetical protein